MNSIKILIYKYLNFEFNKDLEKEFLYQYFNNSIVIVRFGILLGIVLYSLFGILDQYMLPKTKNIAWSIRFFIVVPALTALLAISFWPSFRKIFSISLIACSLLLGFGIISMMYFSQESEMGSKHYYSGLLLVIIWVGTFSQLRFRYVVYVCFTLVSGYLFVVATRQNMLSGGIESQNFPIFLNNIFFLAGSIILAIFSSRAFEKGKRNQFLQDKKIQKLFGQQVSEQVANELVVGDGELGSKACKVTIMFLDIRDFTVLADSKLPHEVASFQNIVFSELIDIIRAYNGIINQFLGDGIMATFGAPITSKSHVKDAVDAGLQMVEKIRQLGEDGKIPPIRVGIGLHTGKVLAGNIGNQYRKQYSITGNTVIVAARIEQLNKELNSQFLISGDAYKKIESIGYSTSYVDNIKLKGMKHPTKIYKLA